MAASTFRALRFAENGSIPGPLYIDLLPIPSSPPAGYSLVRVHAAGRNPPDVGVVDGQFSSYATKLPLTLGRDFAGEVVAGPAEWVGKKVWGTGGLNGFKYDGSHAEYMLVKTEGLAEIPNTLGYSQVTACGVGFLTAGCMIERAAVKKGEYALVLGRYYGLKGTPQEPMKKRLTLFF